MRSLIIDSPAKINLYLNILGKRPDGYHELETLMERVSLCDRITISTRKEPGLELRCSDSALVANNTIIKAHNELQRLIKNDFGVKVFLQKKIPVGSGLGGASSNAAFFILGALKLLNKRIPLPRLYDIGKKVGSDVNFFLSNARYAFCRGRGEQVRPLAITKKYAHYIVFPRLFCSTAKVYAAFSGGLTSNFNSVNILTAGLANSDFALIENGLFNALRAPAERVIPRLEEVRNKISALPVRLYNLTGSGSACFIIDDGNVPKKKLYHLCKKQAWMIYRVQTY